MSDNSFKIASLNKNTRLCVIENSIFIEELASRVLGNILNIDWETSKSFGNTSSCLSFNQKLQLIQDIKGIDKENLKKLTCLTNIRNKFAHVSSIASFNKLFSDSKSGKEIQKNFLKWFFDNKGISDIHPSKIEYVYTLCFYLLVNDVINTLLEINDDHLFNMGLVNGQEEYKNKLIELLIKHLATKEQTIAILKMLESVKKTI